MPLDPARDTFESLPAWLRESAASLLLETAQGGPPDTAEEHLCSREFRSVLVLYALARGATPARP